MKEVYELRMDDEEARLVLSDDEGKRIGPFQDLRVFLWDPGDGRELEFRKVNRKLKAAGRGGLCTSWRAKRIYSRSELEGAEYLKLIVITTFEPAGEECGTEYDEESACPLCGSGAPQSSPLLLRRSGMPKTKDIAVTIAGELVVSRRMADLIRDHQFTGVCLRPIFTRLKFDEPLEDWFQLTSAGDLFDILPPTRAGNDPFDDDEAGKYKCSECGLLGLNLLSEVFMRPVISRSGKPPDFAWSRQVVGVRRGLLRPEHVIIVSKRAWELIERTGLRGMAVEVARFVTGGADPG